MLYHSQPCYPLIILTLMLSILSLFPLLFHSIFILFPTDLSHTGTFSDLQFSSLFLTDYSRPCFSRIILAPYSVSALYFSSLFLIDHYHPNSFLLCHSHPYYLPFFPLIILIRIPSLLYIINLALPPPHPSPNTIHSRDFEVFPSCIPFPIYCSPRNTVT
jgi:hypothetical protein